MTPTQGHPYFIVRTSPPWLSWLLNLALAAQLVGCLGLVSALLVDPGAWPLWLGLGILANQAVISLSLRRVRISGIRHGVWMERAYVLDSIEEATRRDMGATEWVHAYGERALAEARREAGQ